MIHVAILGAVVLAGKGEDGPVWDTSRAGPHVSFTSSSRGVWRDAGALPRIGKSPSELLQGPYGGAVGAEVFAEGRHTVSWRLSRGSVREGVWVGIGSPESQLKEGVALDTSGWGLMWSSSGKLMRTGRGTKLATIKGYKKGDVCEMEFDLDTGKVVLRKNGDVVHETPGDEDSKAGRAVGPLAAVAKLHQDTVERTVVALVAPPGWTAEAAAARTRERRREEEEEEEEDEDDEEWVDKECADGDCGGLPAEYSRRSSPDPE
eukprot:TRINITY_DN3878_c2_g1_i1.p2 TRINITY_DN3878_c2_g1~~TRINITY_DN3878_c2_g1_i1.p2  ORF type:complete len:262 (+),score=66.54 TRINITY_DN3878_c2_g1_i1:74-859(+)